MSQQLINLNADLKRLRDEGYEVEIKSGHILLNHVPYLNSRKEVKFGILASTLMLNGDITVAPDTHVAHLAGEYPCNIDGSAIEQIRHASSKTTLAAGVEVDHSFSAKPPPPNRYENYYEKMKTYADILSGPAINIDPTATAKTFAAIAEDRADTPFAYVDTATSRAQIGVISQKLNIGKVAIIGIGGTGSYLLDLIAKTPIKEIHLFDGDVFLQHNSFRSPGAASLEDLKLKKNKADYFADIYSKMHLGVQSHPTYVDISNVHLLADFNFVFLCLDSGPAKKLIVEKLLEFAISFIDVGMGILEANGSLTGTIRVTTITSESQRLGINEKRISYAEDVDNEYDSNIQIADLNALNASLAVIKWKKTLGFYLDLEREHATAYMVNGNKLLNEDKNET